VPPRHDLLRAVQVADGVLEDGLREAWKHRSNIFGRGFVANVELAAAPF